MASKEGAGPGPQKRSIWQTLWALLRLRCPGCHKARLFRGWFTMNDPCPVCGIIFQREEGYFLGAMYVSYFIGCALLTGAYLLGTSLLPHWHAHAVLACLVLLYVPLTPIMFRYARAIWIYVDRWVFPGDVAATAYEKVRAREIAEKARRGPPGGGGPVGGNGRGQGRPG